MQQSRVFRSKAPVNRPHNTYKTLGNSGLPSQNFCEFPNPRKNFENLELLSTGRFDCGMAAFGQRWSLARTVCPLMTQSGPGKSAMSKFLSHFDYWCRQAQEARLATGVCGKTVPGEGRIAACLLANKSTASKNCAEALQKIEAMAAQ